MSATTPAVIAELLAMAHEYEQALPGNSEIRPLREQRLQALRAAASALEASAQETADHHQTLLSWRILRDEVIELKGREARLREALAETIQVVKDHVTYSPTAIARWEAALQSADAPPDSGETR